MQSAGVRKKNCCKVIDSRSSSFVCCVLHTTRGETVKSNASACFLLLSAKMANLSVFLSFMLPMEVNLLLFWISMNSCVGFDAASHYIFVVSTW